MEIIVSASFLTVTPKSINTIWEINLFFLFFFNVGFVTKGPAFNPFFSVPNSTTFSRTTGKQKAFHISQVNYAKYGTFYLLAFV